MRPLLIIIMTLSVVCSSTQTKQFKIFKTTEYINGNFYRKTRDTLKVASEKIDIYFFKRHFDSPYYLPEKFIDKRYRNQKISVWADPKHKKDYQRNWENSYTFDSLGRVTKYAYSGCMVCSSFPYIYTVTYNSDGQVERIFNTTNERDSFTFFYNDKGNIIKFEKYLFDKLETVIVLIN